MIYSKKEVVLGLKNIKTREMITCECHYCKVYFKTCKDTIKKNNDIICSKCKREQTNIKRYGHKVAFGFGTNEFKDLLKDKYGYENAQQISQIKEKSIKTCILKYGTRTPAENKQIQEKMKNTCIKNYGVKFPAQDKNICKKSILNRTRVQSHYYFDNIGFDSSWELYFYIYHKDLNHNIKRCKKSFTYYKDNKQHQYFPDFEIDEQIYEIKGKHLLNKNGILFDPYKKETLTEKYECMVNNHIIMISDCKKYIDYVKNKYGKNYISKYKCRRNNIA